MTSKEKLIKLFNEMDKDVSNCGMLSSQYLDQLIDLNEEAIKEGKLQALKIFKDETKK